jgi:hypothetical protein
MSTTQMTPNDKAISQLADAIMRGFAAALDYKVADLDRAIAIMRAELKALLFEARYADARACLINRSLNQQYVIALVVTECVTRYQKGN